MNIHTIVEIIGWCFTVSCIVMSIMIGVHMIADRLKRKHRMPVSHKINLDEFEEVFTVCKN